MNDLSSAATVCGAESSNFQVTVVPTETVRVIGVNMKLAISTVDPPPAAAEPPEVEVAAEAGVEDADEFAPPPLELEPHPATARTAISATMARERAARSYGGFTGYFCSIHQCPIHQRRGRRDCLIDQSS
jgi:hypothetical protein